ALYVIASYLGAPNLSANFDRLLPFSPSWSAHFAWQYFLGILVSINLLGFASLRNSDWIRPFERPIRTLAAKTLSVYLFHFPILYFLAATLPATWNPIFRGLVVMFITVIGISVLSRFTEARKLQWRAAIGTAVGQLSFRQQRRF